MILSPPRACRTQPLTTFKREIGVKTVSRIFRDISKIGPPHLWLNSQVVVHRMPQFLLRPAAAQYGEPLALNEARMNKHYAVSKDLA